MNASEQHETAPATPARLWHFLTGVAGLGVVWCAARIVIEYGTSMMPLPARMLLLLLCGGLSLVAGERVMRVQTGWGRLVFWCLIVLVVAGLVLPMDFACMAADPIYEDGATTRVGC